ncbi:MAG: hypothetical protein Q8K85_17100, partial [Hyphomicrobium sp.]|nr:hypothetical protein [Hyphomicrobium sp.]
MTKYLSNLLKRPFSGIIEQLSRMENRVNSIHAELFRLNRELQIAQHDVKTLAGLLARKQPDTIDTELRREIHSRALNVIGVLNWRDDIESGERHFVTQFLKWKPSAVILDVGANLGGYARMVREISADAVLHCFEPHPVSYQSLAAAAASLNIT